MALISCYECNAKISNQADSCPQCGANRVPPAVKDLLERKKLNDRSKFNGQLLILIFGLASLVFAIGKKMEDWIIFSCIFPFWAIVSLLIDQLWKERNNSIYLSFSKLRDENENEWK